MYLNLTQRSVKPTIDSCPRCGEVLSVALPGSLDIERICICRSCAAVVTYGDIDVAGMNKDLTLSSVPLSLRLPAIA